MAPQETVLISLRQISKRYGSRQVLQDVDLDLRQGEVLAIVGPSGCGKTTLLKVLNLIHLPDHGEVTFAGNVVYSHDGRCPREHLATKVLGLALGLDEHSSRRRLRGSEVDRFRRHFGMVFQEFNLWPNLTLFDNIAAPLRWSLKLDRSEIDRRVRVTSKQVQIDDQLGKYPGEVSGGQKQRAGIARALVVQPQVLLLDEITSALDPELVAEILLLVASLRDIGRTMVVVTHHMSFANSIADRVAFLNGGKLVGTSSPRRVLQEPEVGCSTDVSLEIQRPLPDQMT